MRIQVENARKEEGKHFSFSFVQPASKLGDIDDMPWKDNDISVEGEYWFDGSHSYSRYIRVCVLPGAC